MEKIDTDFKRTLLNFSRCANCDDVWGVKLNRSVYQKIPFVTVNQILGCNDARWALVFLKKLFFLPIRSISQLKIRYKCVQYFKPKFLFCFFFCVSHFNFFFFPFTLLFLAFFSRHPFCFILYSFCMAAVKSWVLIMSKAWKWDLDQLMV